MNNNSYVSTKRNLSSCILEDSKNSDHRSIQILYKYLYIFKSMTCLSYNNSINESYGLNSQRKINYEAFKINV